MSGQPMIAGGARYWSHAAGSWTESHAPAATPINVAAVGDAYLFKGELCHPASTHSGINVRIPTDGLL